MFYVSRFDSLRVWVYDTDDNIEESISFADALCARDSGVVICGMEDGMRPSVHTGFDIKALTVDGVAVVVRGGIIVHLQPLLDDVVVVPSRYGSHTECMLVSYISRYTLILDDRCSFSRELLLDLGIRCTLDISRLSDDEAGRVYNLLTRSGKFNASLCVGRLVDLPGRLRYWLCMCAMMGKLDYSVLETYGVSIDSDAERDFLRAHKGRVIASAYRDYTNYVMPAFRKLVLNGFTWLSLYIEMDRYDIMPGEAGKLLGYIMTGGKDVEMQDAYKHILGIMIRGD